MTNYEIDGKMVSIEGVKIIPRFKNFSGERWDNQGNRSFTIVIEDEDLLQALMNIGYKITYFDTEDEEGNPISIPELKIKVRFDKFPPEVYTLTGDENGPVTKYNGETAKELDNLRFLNCDIVFTPYTWSSAGKSGTVPYLKKLIAIVPKEAFADKYPQLYGMH